MVVELNPLPGILPDPRDNSCLPMAARAAGMSYDELIQAVGGHRPGAGSADAGFSRPWRLTA